MTTRCILYTSITLQHIIKISKPIIAKTCTLGTVWWVTYCRYDIRKKTRYNVIHVGLETFIYPFITWRKTGMSSPNVIGSVISVSMGPPASYRSGYLSLSKVRDAKFYIYVNSYIWYTICRKNTLLKHIISSGKKPGEKMKSLAILCGIFLGMYISAFIQRFCH